MADRYGPMRVVPPLGEPRLPPSRRRRPGIAVVVILLYAAVFGAGLLWIRARSPLLRSRGPAALPGPKRAAAGSGPAATASGPTPAAPAPASEIRPRDVRSRAALLAGEGLAGAALAEYGRRISRERCTCGCGLALRKCLAQDRSCSRSPEIAEKIRASIPATQ